MSLKCDKCRDLKCKQAERNCKGFLDAAGKWIGGVVNAAGEIMFIKVAPYSFYDRARAGGASFSNLRGLTRKRSLFLIFMTSA